MKVVAIKDFTLAGENHVKGEVFECDQMRGEAWVIAGVVRRATAEDEKPKPEATDPKTRQIIDEETDE